MMATNLPRAAHGPSLRFQQLETIIRRDPIAQSQHGRMEFGSVRMEEGQRLAEVMFVNNDGRVQPFLYKLLPERNSWKIVNVQRMWFVRGHTCCGVLGRECVIRIMDGRALSRPKN